MTGPSTEEDLPAEDPVRWSTGHAPPGGLELLATLERPIVLPPALRTAVRGRLSRAVTPPASRWITPTTVASAVVVGGLVLWLLQSAAPTSAPAPIAIAPDTDVGASRAPTDDMAAGSIDESLSGVATPPPDEPNGVVSPAPIGDRGVPAVVARGPHDSHDSVGEGGLGSESEVAAAIGTGVLLVNSTPWSRVTVDGRAFGTTPQRIDLPAGSHRVRLETAEGVARELDVVIAASETTRIVRDLHGGEGDEEPAPDPVSGSPSPGSAPDGVGTGRLFVNSTPWSTVSVDGDVVGTTPVVSLELTAGVHVVRLVTAEGVSRELMVTITAGETRRITHDLSAPAGSASAPRALLDDDVASAPDEPSLYDAARAAALTGNHREVIRILNGHARTQREFELLILCLRAVPGMETDVVRNMRAYLARFPGTPRAQGYQQYLMTHGD